jgi:Flp pilus assembly protein TadG
MKRFYRHQEGQQMILVALMLPLLLTVMGLVVDVGNAYMRQRRAQNAADAAAAAAGMVLHDAGVSIASSTAFSYAAQYGYDNNGTTNIVTVSSPPTSGAYAGNTRYIQVEVQDNVAPIFASIVWNGSFTVRARASAGYVIKTLGADILVLKDTPCNPSYISVTMNGNYGLITSAGGTVQVNSPCNGAVAVGNGDIHAGRIRIVGPGYSTGPNGHLVPAPILNASPIPDPLANLATPSTAGCVTRTGPVGGRYLPGIYASNFTPNFSYSFDGSGGECNGVFYFRGSLSTNDDVINVINGMFYFEAGGLSLGGNAKMQGTAPVVGPYAGMLVFMARNNYSTFDMRGTPQVFCTPTTAATKGLIYLPKGHLNILGTADACFAGSLTAWTIAQNGNATSSVVVEYPYTAPGNTYVDSLVE